MVNPENSPQKTFMMETFKTLVYSCNNVYTYPQNYVQRKCFTGNFLLLF